jgi:hypothetical protein
LRKYKDPPSLVKAKKDKATHHTTAQQPTRINKAAAAVCPLQATRTLLSQVATDTHKATQEAEYDIGEAQIQAVVLVIVNAKQHNILYHPSIDQYNSS